MRIAESLVASGVVGAEQMRGLTTQFGTGAQLRAKILAEGIADDATIAQSLAQLAAVPFIDLKQEPLDAEVIGMIPAVLCRRYQLLPIRRTRRHLLVGMLDPSDLNAIDDITTATGLSIQPAAVATDALELAFTRFLRSDGELSELKGQMLDESGVTEAELHDDLETASDDDAPVVRFVSLLISQAIDDRASDIHIEPGEKSLIVRYRIDGVLKETQQASRAIQDGVISRLKIMAAVDIAERRKPQDGRISVQHNGKKVDLRLATLPTVWGEKIVMRILANSTQNLSLKDLAFSSKNQELFRQAISKPYGMVLVTGPTGSGKSTTLYTALSEIATPQVNAITVEDPVEFRLAGINQVQVNHKAGLNFHTALRSILRSDPDIVMVGEIETKRPRTCRSRRRSPATWCCRRCTRTTPRARSPVSSTWGASRFWSVPQSTRSSRSASPAASAAFARWPTTKTRRSSRRSAFRCRRACSSPSTSRAAARSARTPATAAASHCTRS